MNKFSVLLCFLCFLSPAATAEKLLFVPDVTHEVFRDQIVQFVRAAAEEHIQQAPLAELNQLEQHWDNQYQRTNWQITVSAYHQGDKVGKGYANGRDLTSTLRQATLKAMQANGDVDSATLDNYHFKIDFDYHPSRRYSIVEFQGQGLEALGNRVTVRRVNSESIQKQINASLAYLLRQQDPQLHGFFKFYNADKDEAENLLRTTYSATALYTLIKLNALQPDPAIEARFTDIADFLLARQLKTGPHAGGFDYGYNPETDKGTCRIVVGTTSKTIYTLLLMHQIDPENTVYLDAARAAGDWLLTMIKDDGNVIPVARCKQGNWTLKDKQSFLYTGQVLSALSRLYAVTENQSYLNGAHKIAELLLKEVAEQGPLVADDYRPANSISSSWVMMSLIDLAKVDPNPVYRKTIIDIAEMLLQRQIVSQNDLFSHGRYLDAMTTSGNGWINEVMGDWYDFCSKHQLTDCQPYREAMWRTSRWLIQNAYSPHNSYDIANPGRADGGMITNFNTWTVRTDAVCHALNGMISLLRIESGNKQNLVILQEQPLREILPLMRAGNE